MALSKGFRLNSAPAPLDFRLAQQGLLTRASGGGPRSGVLFVTSADGNVLTRSASALSVTLLDQTVLALARNVAGTDGIDYLTNVGAIVQGVNAPTANSWYATFWARQNDNTGAGGVVDPDSVPTFGVTYSAAAASPAIPAAPTGATKIGHMLIPSTATTAQTAGVVYTETIAHTSLIGGRIRYRSTTEMNADVANLNDGAMAFVRSGDLYFLKGGSWLSMTDDTGWVNLTPSRAGVTLNAAEPAQYRILRGLVYLRGQFDVTTNAGNGVFATLPVGARPLAQRYIDVPNNTNRVVIGIDGTVGVNMLAGVTYVRLDGMAYPTF